MEYCDYENIGKELYPRFAKFECALKNNWNELLYKINDNFLDSGKISIQEEYWDWFSYDNQLESFGYVPSNAVKNPLIIELGLKNEIRQKETLAHFERVKKLHLGFYVQLMKRDNVITICKAYDEKFKLSTRVWDYDILGKYIFPNYQKIDDKFFLYKNYLNKENGEIYYDYYAETSIIQKLRNDFCHFQFNIQDFQTAKELLDKYIVMLTK
ncbi:hypothetical protein [Candidatus Deianiraea vastatrix]|uniref:Uncharacterized protein n=1 Tax=Candidatus Deianiraea vastatrix TaxID=2163644 RepID=A0A5B8XGV2_9RICK|nr:hypothetical protein [Candidatus Deianiraea vastatrix]QED23117.1 hypothetical protein Deia_00310 [Candidatus Deianiraea vastatrix]